MNKEYFDFVTKLEDMGVSDDYLIGWQEGYLRSPKLEEQRAVSYTHLTLPTINWV